VSSSKEIQGANPASGINPVRKLLIANRNEIAVRIIKAAQALGIRTVAVYSEADRQALHVEMADESYCIGGAASLDSYLRIDALIDAAKRSGADAIHPGYGFVSENPLLPRACAEAGITLVGPDEQAMADMADKAQAKAIADKAGLPCIPGFNEPGANLDTLMKAAEKIGYPVMIKALAGGGGRGMRLVQHAGDFASQLLSAQNEARNAFNDDRVMLEKAILNPRHVEIQVLADRYGHGIHLGERDCTVQRRHQKIVEEAPSPAVNAELRAQMGAAALKLVRATGYIGAGTVEFLLDERGEFYFIEMNTRLQVEHGVTELITGLDLVQWQLRIAGGEPLSLQQADVQFNGHAIQGRLCAEDPAKDFMPQTGPVLDWQVPQGKHIRVDHALSPGGEVSPWYDSMLAKVMVHAPSRQQACMALADAFSRTVLVGFEHNAQYLQRIAEHEVFQSGKFSTAFLGEYGPTLLAGDRLENSQINPSVSEELLAVSVFLTQEPQGFEDHTQSTTKPAWPSAMTGFSSTQALVRPVRLLTAGRAKPVELNVSSINADRALGQTGKCFAVQADISVIKPKVEVAAEVPAPATPPVHQITDWSVQRHSKMGLDVVQVRCFIDGLSRQMTLYVGSNNGSNSGGDHGGHKGVWVKSHLNARAIWVEDHSHESDAAAGEGQFQPNVKSPMNGKLTRIDVQVGQTVKAGDVLACLEAMKMEHRITAKSDAMVDVVQAVAGAQMGVGQIILTLKPLQ
jgi:geranyl-CoA carboxylase alpha subunit